MKQRKRVEQLERSQPNRTAPIIFRVLCRKESGAVRKTLHSMAVPGAGRLVRESGEDEGAFAKRVHSVAGATQ